MYSIICTKSRNHAVSESHIGCIRSQSATVAQRALERYAKIHGYSRSIDSTSYANRRGDTVELRMTY